MTKLYMLTLGLATTLLAAQIQISFENSEGFTPGTVAGQNGWEVTLNSDENPINNQDITTEKASVGTQSLKIDVDFDEDFGWFPIYGAAKELEAPVSFNDATVEFDVYMTELDGSTFEFGTWGISGADYVPVSVFSFNYTGNLEIVSSEDYDYDQTAFTWEAEKWYHVKAEINPTTIKYYIDNVLVYSGDNYSSANIGGMTFVHDNFSGAAYVDNIKITGEVLGTKNVKNSKVSVYPNPVSAELNLALANGEKALNVEIYNMAGQKVLEKKGSSKIDMQRLAPGTYIVKTLTDKGTVTSTTIIKK